MNVRGFQMMMLGLCGLWAGPVFGQVEVHASQQTRLSGEGVGQIEAQPTSLFMLFTVEGKADLASDALVKYRDEKRRATQTFEALEIDGLSIESCGMSLNLALSPEQLQQMQQGQLTEGSGFQRQTVASEILQLVVSDIDTLTQKELLELLTRLLETAGDAGLTVGPTLDRNNWHMAQQPMAVFGFRVDDPEAFYTQARQLAIADARAKAQTLAQETGVQLGDLLMVNANQNQNYGRHYGNYNNMWNQYLQQAQLLLPNGTNPSISNRIAPIKFTVRISLHFSIHPKKSN